MAVFTGARLEELDQLLVSDVHDEGGVAYIHINQQDEAKSLKTIGSERRIPIHRELKKLGFMEYVSGLKETGEIRLFPDLKPRKVGSDIRWTTNYSEWWARYRGQMGLDDPRKPFHSFRHAFKDAARNSDVERSKYDELKGHVDGTTSGRYGMGSSLTDFDRALQKIQYAGLDLRHPYR